MNTLAPLIQKFLNESEYCEQDATEHGSAYAELSKDRTGVSVQYREGYGWSAAVFTPADTFRTSHYAKRRSAIRALKMVQEFETVQTLIV